MAFDISNPSDRLKLRLIMLPVCLFLGVTYAACSHDIGKWWDTRKSLCAKVFSEDDMAQFSKRPLDGKEAFEISDYCTVDYKPSLYLTIHRDEGEVFTFERDIGNTHAERKYSRFEAIPEADEEAYLVTEDGSYELVARMGGDGYMSLRYEKPVPNARLAAFLRLLKQRSDVIAPILHPDGRPPKPVPPKPVCETLLTVDDFLPLRDQPIEWIDAFDDGRECKAELYAKGISRGRLVVARGGASDFDEVLQHALRGVEEGAVTKLRDMGADAFRVATADGKTVFLIRTGKLGYLRFEIGPKELHEDGPERLAAILKDRIGTIEPYLAARGKP